MVNIDDIKKLVTSKCPIFDDVKYIGKHKDMDLYSPCRSDGRVPKVGLPMFVVVKNGEAKWIGGLEGFEFHSELIEKGI